MAFSTALIEYGILGQFILPFLIFFAIIYGSLRTANVFKEKHINAIIAASTAVMATSSTQIVSELFAFMPIVIVLLVAFFVKNLFYVLLGSPGERGIKENADMLLLVGGLLFILAIWGKEFIPDTTIISQTNIIFLFALLGVFIVWKRAG